MVVTHNHSINSAGAFSCARQGRCFTKITRGQAHAQLGRLVLVRAGLKVGEERSMPFLPFTLSEVMIPGMTKDLHLFEDRYLEMLRRVMVADKQFVHVVLEPANSPAAVTPGALVTDGVAVCFPVIVKVADTRELSYGTMVRIQAVQRACVNSADFTGSFHSGTVSALPDEDVKVPEIRGAVLRLLPELQSLVADVNLLYAKLPKSPEGAQLRRALQWVDVMDYLRMSPDDKDFARAQRLAYATLVPPSGPTPEDNRELQERRLIAMSTQDVEMQLKSAIEWLQYVRSGLSARLALSGFQSPDPPDAKS